MGPISAELKKGVAYLLSFVLILAAMPESGALSQTQESQAPPGSPVGAPLSEQELDSLASPIALYPDSLVAQILSAATFPDQIAVANYWLQQNKNLTGSALMQAVNTQSWDPSVKALTQFPSVLNNMAQNLSWTSQLGEAYHNQQSDVMSAIQALRQQAKNSGNLKSTPQQAVTTQTQGGQQVIVIQTSNPQVVYVPTYNPTVIYGTPYNPPGYSTGDLVATGLLSFGAGIAVGAMMSGGCCGWGWSGWSCSWYHGGAYYGGHVYYGNAAWHGGYYNTGYQHYGNNYQRNTNYAHNTNVSGNTVNINRSHTASNSFDKSGSNSWDKSGWSNSDAAHGWGSQDRTSGSTALSSYGHNSSSSSGSGGWADRSSSSRGWASRGGGGGWGGGGSRGGGFRR